MGSEYLATEPDEELERALLSQGTRQVRINRKSEQLNQAWQALDPKPFSMRGWIFDQGGTQEHFAKVQDIIEDTRLGLTYTDRLVKQLQIGNGERARYLATKAAPLAPEERTAFIMEQRRKKIMTDEMFPIFNTEIRRIEGQIEPTVRPE